MLTNTILLAILIKQLNAAISTRQVMLLILCSCDFLDAIPDAKIPQTYIPLTELSTTNLQQNTIFLFLADFEILIKTKFYIIVKK